MRLPNVRVVFLLALIALGAIDCNAQSALGAGLGFRDDGILGGTDTVENTALTTGNDEDLPYPLEYALSVMTGLPGIGPLLQQSYNLLKNLDALTNGRIGELLESILPCTVPSDWTLKCEGLSKHGGVNGAAAEIGRYILCAILEQLVSRFGTAALFSS